MADGYGDCWCCAFHSIRTAAVSTLGLCRPCGSRSPSACDNAHRSVPQPAGGSEVNHMTTESTEAEDAAVAEEIDAAAAEEAAEASDASDDTAE